MRPLFGSLVFGLALWGLATSARPAEPSVGVAQAGGAIDPAKVIVAQVSGVIDPINAQYLARVLNHAEAIGAELAVIELNTPGGLATSMEKMAERLLASTVPTVVYVTPTGARAGSAGVFLAMAADIVAMAPGTVIGAAHPVSLGGGQADQAIIEKATNYAAAYARTLASAKGHNADWAEQAVRASATVTDQEALQQGIADVLARDLPQLLERLEGRRVNTAGGERVLPSLRGAEIQRHPPNFAENALHVISDPNIALLLLSIGSIGVIAELYHPGAFFPGIFGAICLLVGFVALGNLPTNWGAAALLGLSLLLFLLELKIPSHGILGAGGLVAFVLGGLLLFAPLAPVAPVFETVEVNRWLIVAMGGLLAVFFFVALRAVLHARRMPVVDPLLRLAGATGVATTPLTPQGTVLVLNEQWSALADGDSIEAGEAVEVVSREGLTIHVRRLTPAAGLEGR